jgi:arginyl-tRNA synthetase
MEKQISLLLQKIIREKYDVSLDEIKLEFPPKKDLWDFAFGCFVLSRDLKKNPAMIAGELSNYLKEENLIDDANPAGPYINLKISKNIFTDAFTEMYSDQTNFLSPQVSKGEKIVIDYIGTCVGKPLHIGHMCTPNIGQTMINIYNKIGYEVISDSHIWDWGIIFGKLITAYKLWWDESRLSENAVDYLLELYVKITAEAAEDPILEQQTRDEFKLLSEWNLDSKKLWAEFTSHSIEAMNIQLARLNVYPQYNVGESFYEGIGLAKMENYPDLKDDMHTIVNELVERWIATKNEDNSVWVVFSDESKLTSCILQKRDGTHWYLASDLACIKYRMQNWSPDKIVYFVDVRQQLHFQQAFEIAKNAGWLDFNRDKKDHTDLFHAYNGFISGKDGPFSSRKWNIIKLDKLLDQAEDRAKKIILEKRDDISEKELSELSKIIWIGAIKYGHLKKSRESDMIFDWDEFMTFEGNSGPYIQYAFVRANRVLEKYGKEISSEITWTFDSPEEVELVKLLWTYKENLLKTAETNMPHHMCKYAFTLTKAFSTFYNAVHILNEEDESKKMIRLQLVDLFAKTLNETFWLLGIDMPDKM